MREEQATKIAEGEAYWERYLRRLANVTPKKNFALWAAVDLGSALREQVSCRPERSAPSLESNPTLTTIISFVLNLPVSAA